jgi:hypothetical protein
MQMAKKNRLTNNSDEADIASLMSGDVVFSIPFFQRSYKWKPERLTQLNEDILSIVDQASEFHFLGAVILHGRSSNPSDPKVFEVIDGQQRITTLILYVAAAVKTLAEWGQLVEAAGLFLKYLVIPRDTNLHSNVKLHPCREDRAQCNSVITDLLKIPGLKDKVNADKIKMLPPSGKETGTLRNNYRSALRFFKSQYEQGGLERVQAVYKAMLQSISVVQIDVWDPTNGPKIFDSLNSRQEPMTIGDLVRNEIFARVADEHPDDIEHIDQHSWQPFYKKFQADGHNLFDSFFFPYGLIRDPNLRKSDVYGSLRDHWADIDDPKTIIGELAKYQDAFIDIVRGKNTQSLSGPVASSLKRLHASGAPSSTYPFLMQLAVGVRDGSVGEKSAREALEVIESFLIRRAASGHEPTGLHAVFKRLWVDCDGKPDGARVAHEIRQHKTVVWPSDDAFKEAIRARPLYGSAVTNYLLREYNRSLGGDQPGSIPWIEHVLPETPMKEWFQVFTKEQHKEMKDLLANLIPLSMEMNSSLGNKAYADKRGTYEQDSMFKAARQFALTYTEWTPDTLESRANSLADWCAERWHF